MRMRPLRMGLAVLVVSSVCALLAWTGSARIRLSPQEAAALFAGRPISAPLAILAALPPIAHARADAKRHINEIINRTGELAAWSRANHLPAATSVFYPFSGPDVAFPLALFPAAHTYVLVGTESPWPSKGGDPLVLRNAIPLVRRLPAMLEMPADAGYFFSPVMQKSENGGAFPGVLALSLAMIAGSGGQILQLEHVCLDSTGRLQSTGDVCGFRLDLVMADGVAHQLVYLQLPLDDDSLVAHPGLAAMLANSPYAFYCKSAIYKFQEPSFSRVRSLALAAMLIVQDESCLPFKAFDSNKWDLRLFGVYQRALFDQNFQPDLALRYNDRSRIGSVPQISGYNGQLNQLIATPRSP